tara:strand:- start:4180 stop:4785 length:606 start_codon:yes stop_codon:yes gene_type:complete
MANLVTTTMTRVEVNSGKVTGRGTLPIGAIIGVIANADYTLPTGTNVDDWGMMLCAGGTVPAGNTLAGTALPNVSDSRFLLGGTSTGANGGENSHQVSNSEMPSHSHSTNNTGGHSHGSGGHNHSHTWNRNGHWGSGTTNYSGWCRDNGVGGTYGYGSDGRNHGHNWNGANHGHNTNGTGGNSSVNIMPPYNAVIYLMRVN